MKERNKEIIAKCIVFPVYFVSMPITFIAGGLKGIIETWKMFIEIRPSKESDRKRHLRKKQKNTQQENVVRLIII